MCVLYVDSYHTMCITHVCSENYQTGGENGMKGTGNLKNKALRTVEKIVRREVAKNASGWPPECTGYFHQPKRPVQQKKK